MEKILDILEFNKIKEELLKYNINSLSRKIVNDLNPFFSSLIVKEELEKTNEGYVLKNLGTFPNLGPLCDLQDYIYEISKGKTLAINEIYEFVEHFEIIDSLIKFNKEVKKDLFHFNNYVNSLKYIREIVDRIKSCISIQYKIYDNASSKLKTIRAEIKKCESSLKERLNSYLKNNADILAETLIVSRNNHLVLPVKASEKNKIKGVIIDSSDTGQTVYIEPYSVVEINIKLESLRYEEELEINRILRALCLIIDKNSNEISNNNKILAEISYMYLKGCYGISNNYEIASLSEKPSIKLSNAKHPLIDATKVIANDYELGENSKNIIVISGPNAGGKTVSLKTVALLVIMNQCGLPLPVDEAKLYIFKNIFVDIGDEQSISQSLSGFSSHITNLIKIINNVDNQSLVILDELGSRTDPSEGEALAKAIIDFVDNKRSLAMITTHFLGIKNYSNKNNSIMLASMGFNIDNLTPTYKLVLNSVGRSYAFEISQRLGLKEEIINKAREFKNQNSQDINHLIDELTKSNLLLDQQKEEINEIKKQLSLKEEELNNELSKIKSNKEKLLLEVNEMKEKMLENAYQEINEIITELKNNSQEYKPHLKNQAIEKLSNLEDNKTDTIHEEVVNQDLKINDTVLIKSLNKVGIVTAIKNDNLTVVSNNTTLKLKKYDVSKVKPEKKKDKPMSKVRTVRVSNQRSVGMSLNLIGKRVEEALIELDRYLDAALINNYKEVSIIHGVGTGVLRKAVQEHLRIKKFIDSYRNGMYGEGGAGVTVVYFNKG